MLEDDPGAGHTGDHGKRSTPVVLTTLPAPGLAEIRLDSPASRNSLSLAMLQQLRTAIANVSANDAVKAVILSGSGPAFCAGHDLRELNSHREDADRGRAFFETVMKTCSQVMLAIVNSPKPFIAAVEGTATAAGCQLVASCDLAVASRSARFCTPGVNIGLFCSTPMVALSRNVSRKHALEMLLLGDLIDAESAVAIGLVNRVGEPDQVMAMARDFADRIAAKSAATVRIGKAAFYRQHEMELDAAYDYTAAIMVENLLAADAEEGICAFLDKRAPVWKER